LELFTPRWLSLWSRQLLSCLVSDSSAQSVRLDAESHIRSQTAGRGDSQLERSMAAEIHLLLRRVWREPAQTKSLSLSHEISRLSPVVSRQQWPVGRHHRAIRLSFQDWEDQLQAKPKLASGSNASDLEGRGSVGNSRPSPGLRPPSPRYAVEARADPEGVEP
jgi:hypothetical protein